MEKQKPLSSEQLEQLVKEADLGGRDPGGRVGLFLSLIAAGWSLFQVWYASPLPFLLRLGLFNDTEARAIHLAVAIFLAFTLFPAFRSSSRRWVPAADWVLAAV
ncbi:MAG: C4-dicarboxylate ABC transporter, partial [Candidatus Rokuibacteriota bacterium]